MKIHELIEALREYDQMAEVHFAYNYGDHGRTMVAPKVRKVEDGMVCHSAYHDMDRLADEDDEGNGKLVEEVVILR